MQAVLLERTQPHVLETRLHEASAATWRSIAPQWQDLAEISAEVPLFVGVAWVSTWLEVFGGSLEPALWTLRSGSSLEAACLLTSRREMRGPIPVRCVYLNTSGEASGEGVCVEYNQLLVRPGREEVVVSELAQTLGGLAPDEFVAPGLTPEAIGPLRCALPDWSEEALWSEDPFVDLARLRREGTEYRRAVPSRNTRAQINRSLRAYAELGEVRTEIAGSAAHARSLLDELIELHQAAWIARGRAGAFAARRNRDFHRRFVARAFASGAVQLMRITAGAETVGVIYCFVDRGRAYFYQSGLTYSEGTNYRPGLVAHVCAIQRCMEQGLHEYHFLAGDESTPRYKTSLSTDHRKLAWVRWQRPGLKSRAIRGLRTLKRWLAQT